MVLRDRPLVMAERPLGGAREVLGEAAKDMAGAKVRGAEHAFEEVAT